MLEFTYKFDFILGDISGSGLYSKKYFFTTKNTSALTYITVDVCREKMKKAWTQSTVYKLSGRSCPFTKLKNK